jgi:hypothetical protein
MHNPRSRTIYDWALEGLSILFLTGTFYPLLFLGQFDDNSSIPVHFNIYGEIDRWGSPNALLHIPLLSLLFYCFLTFVERFYKKFNYPVKINTEKTELANVIYRLGVRLMRHLKLLLIILFCYVSNSTFCVTIGKCNGINMVVFTVAWLIGIIFLLLFFSKKMIKVKNSNSML